MKKVVYIGSEIREEISLKKENTGSYVISVSAGTGCYRHIQISKNETLYGLHEAILNAFEFIDDHAHAFFMDNKTWSQEDAYYSMIMNGDERLTEKYKLKELSLMKGKQFKYVFDFGEEWRFQCKVLRELEEGIKGSQIIREVGEPPEQYSAEDWWDEDEEDEEDFLPDIFPQEVIQAELDRLPLPEKTIKTIHQYFEAGARLYGVVPVRKLLELYNSQNAPVEEELFLKLAQIIRHEENFFYILSPEEYEYDAPTNPHSWDVIDSYLLQIDSDDYPNMVENQGNKPYKIFTKEEFLPYADREYYPKTPQNEAMRQYLLKKDGVRLPEETWMGIQDMIAMDMNMASVLRCCELEGLVLDDMDDVKEFAALFMELNNHTPKQVNRGYTPNELSKETRVKQYPWQNVQNEAPARPHLTIVGTPSRNGPCPCGSGRKYKNCCGK